MAGKEYRNSSGGVPPFTSQAGQVHKVTTLTFAAPVRPPKTPVGDSSPRGWSQPVKPSGSVRGVYSYYIPTWRRSAVKNFHLDYNTSRGGEGIGYGTAVPRRRQQAAQESNGCRAGTRRQGHSRQHAVGEERRPRSSAAAERSRLNSHEKGAAIRPPPGDLGKIAIPVRLPFSVKLSRTMSDE